MNGTGKEEEMKKVYIDGQSGTTGLQIYDRIGQRTDLELLRIPEDKRHDKEERKKYLNAADIVFLCLPDEGAREAVSLIDNPEVRVIDASTAHRISPDWTYGFPELSKEQREAIEEDPRMAQVVEYLEKPLPANWDKLDLDTRRMFLEGDTEYDPESLVEREAVSNMEIWVECFGKKAADMERKDSDAITALMMKVDGWERSGVRRRIGFYGQQRIYKRVTSETDFEDF